MKNRRVLALVLAVVMLLAMAAPAMADDLEIEVEGGAEEIADLGGLDLSQLGDGEGEYIPEDDGAGAEVALDADEQTEQTEPAGQAEEVAPPEATQVEPPDLSQEQGQEEEETQDIEPTTTGETYVAHLKEDPDTKFGTLQDAVDSELSQNKTIVLDVDIDTSSPIKIESGKTVTIDLNSKKVTFSDNLGSTFKVEGTLTTTGEGTITHAEGKTGHGVYVEGGTFNMQGGTITGNNSADMEYGGGGVVVTGSGATFNMSGGKITGNSAQNGGGVCVNGRNGEAFFNMSGDAEISGNSAVGEEPQGFGGGVVVTGINATFNMSGGTISKNTALNEGAKLGGGVYLEDGKFNMTGGTISENRALNGGGVYVTGNSPCFTLDGGTLSGNGKAADGSTKTSYGGGVYVNCKGTGFIMKSGTVSGNTVYGNGGGVYVSGSTVEMTGGTISGNTAGTGGGGLCVEEKGTFNLSGGTVTDNTSNAFGGGGLYVSGGTLNMTGGAITKNNADSGGGVYAINDSQVTLEKGEITLNTAAEDGTSEGGGLVINGSTFTMSGGTISGNVSDHLGGGVYLKYGGAATVTGGEITGNTASASGGGVVICTGTTFNVSGKPGINGNTANGDSDDVSLQPEAKINVTGPLSGAWIGVRQAAEDLGKDFTSGYKANGSAEAPSKFFSSNDDTYGVVWNEAEAEAVLMRAVKGEVTDYTGVYDGKAHGGTVKAIEPASGVKIEYCEDFVAEDWSETPLQYTDAGEYLVWVKLSAKGYAYRIMLILVNIEKADPELKVSVKDVTYGEKPSPTVSGNEGKGAVKFLYASAASSNAVGNAATEWSETVPTAVGDYQVKAVVEETKNYKAGESKPAQFRIHHAKLTVKAQDATKVEGEKDPEFKYTVDGLVGSDTITGALARETGETAGTYKITLGTLSAGDNYRIDFTGATFTITGKDAPKPEPQPTDKPEPKPTDKPEPEDKEIAPVVATVTACGKDALKIAWTRVSQADGYDVYLSKRGEPLKQLGSTDKRFVKVSGLKKQTLYRVVVKAWTKEDGDKTTIATSPTAYAYTSDGNKKTTNPKCVTVKARKVSLKVGKKTTIKASVKGVKSGKKLLDKGGKIRYVSSDPSIAKVNSKGRITAVSKGTCVIYVLASNGVYKTVTVKVK